MAIFPTGVSTDSDLYVAVNNRSTTLTLAIGAGDTTIDVTSTTGFPSVGVITIDLEAIRYTGITATSFTGCTRGFDGTTAASHLILAQVKHTNPAIHHNALKDEIKAIEQNLSDRIGLSATQILTPAGSAAAPAIGIGDNDEGFYKAGSFSVGLTIQGVSRVQWDDTAMTPSTDNTYSFGSPALGFKQIFLKNATAAAPAYTFRDNPTSGLYMAGGSEVGIAANGLAAAAFTSAQAKFPDGTVSLPGVTLLTEINSGLYKIGSNHIGLATGGVLGLDIDSGRRVGIAGTITSAQLAVNSTTRGFLPPRMTRTERLAISSPATGLQVHDTTDKSVYQYDGSFWVRLDEYVLNVKDAGAIGDAATDDTAAIQAALDSLPVGGKLFFPAGDYKITAQLDIDASNRITIEGESTGATTLKYNPAVAGRMFLIAGTQDNITFKHISLDHSNADTVVGSRAIVVSGGATRFFFENVHFSRFNRHGIDFGSGVHYIDIRNCRFIQIKDTTSTFVARAILVEAGNDVTIEENYFAQNDQDVAVSAGTKIQILRNTFEVSGDSNNTLISENNNFANTNDLVIAGNYYEGCDDNGGQVILLTDTVNTVISNNYFNGKDGVTDKSTKFLTIRGSSTRFPVIRDNTFVDIITAFIDTDQLVRVVNNYYNDASTELTTLSGIYGFFTGDSNIDFEGYISGQYVHAPGGVRAIEINDAGVKIRGTTTNDSATTGDVGEYVQSVVSAVSVGATDTYSDTTSISLTAGDWDISGLHSFIRNGATFTDLDLRTGISTTSGNSGTGLVFGENATRDRQGNSNTFLNVPGSVPVYRVSISATTTFYLKNYVGSYSAATPQVSGRLSARRVR